MAIIGDLNALAQGLIENLHPSSRRELAVKITKALRASQAARIAEQKNPDGNKFAPRKKQLRKKGGSVRRKMFNKIRQNKHLKIRATQNAASIFFSKKTERIANEHQFGLNVLVNREHGIRARFERRELLGFSDADIDLINDIVIEHLVS